MEQRLYTGEEQVRTLELLIYIGCLARTVWANGPFTPRPTNTPGHHNPPFNVINGEHPLPKKRKSNDTNLSHKVRRLFCLEEDDQWFPLLWRKLLGWRRLSRQFQPCLRHSKSPTQATEPWATLPKGSNYCLRRNSPLNAARYFAIFLSDLCSGSGLGATWNATQNARIKELPLNKSSDCEKLVMNTCML